MEINSQRKHQSINEEYKKQRVYILNMQHHYIIRTFTILLEILNSYY